MGLGLGWVRVGSGLGLGWVGLGVRVWVGVEVGVGAQGRPRLVFGLSLTIGLGRELVGVGRRIVRQRDARVDARLARQVRRRAWLGLRARARARVRA